jgi:L-ascorbate metabolism protein UlaG (beta-lactamase superfamily)
VTLLSHVHGDHIGDARLNQDPSSPTAACDPSFPKAPAAPNSNLAEITAAKNAAFIGTPPDAQFLLAKLQSIAGPSAGLCLANPFSPAPIMVPVAAPCVGLLHFGARRTVQRAGANGLVQISVVTAKHDNSIPVDLLANPLQTQLASQGLTLEPGEPVGYVITFSNGLTVYLSGDTGQTSDMSVVVRDQYRADLAVINIGDVFTTGPEQAAFAMNHLVQPKSVIPSHANEVATSGGKVLPGTQTAKFLSLLEMPGHVPLSGRTMQFDGEGRCVAGCM